jgi:hypothetical protein
VCGGFKGSAAARLSRLELHELERAAEVLLEEVLVDLLDIQGILDATPDIMTDHEHG